jgi:putative FmdB family regulatory protein
MPKYVYRCKECAKIFEKTHSMSERLTDCEYCNSIESLLKLPRAPSIHYSNGGAGNLVDDYIKEAKEELASEKEKLKTQDYEQ